MGEREGGSGLRPVENYRGRTASCPTAPARIGACGFPAPGSQVYSLPQSSLLLRYSLQEGLRGRPCGLRDALCTLQLFCSIVCSRFGYFESVYRSALMGFVRRDGAFLPSLCPRPFWHGYLLIAATLGTGGWLDLSL